MTGETGVIVGGGIGGLCAAVALRQAGVEVRVYEAAATAGPVGAGIWVAPNAMEALNRMGLAEAVAARGSAIAKVQLFDRRGTILSTVQGSYLRERFGHTITAIHRAELHQVLLTRLEEDIVIFGKRCQSFHEDDAGVHVSFEDGTTVAGSLALRRYEHVRKAKATRVTRESWRYGKLAASENPMMCFMRNHFIRLTPDALSRRYLEWLFRLKE